MISASVAKTISAGALLLMSAISIAAPPPKPDYAARGARCWKDVAILADDAMEGRRAGTPGHRRAAEFVAEQFRLAGLQPGGDDGYIQHVNLESRTIRENESRLALVGASGEQPLRLGDDAYFSLRGNFAPEVDAPMVFAGYGLKLPQYQFDDLAGIDLRGKVVVTFVAAPKSVPGTAAAHFGSALERWRVYREAGAVGVIAIPNPFSMDLPWERAARMRFEPYLALMAPEPDLYAGQQVWVQFNPARIATLLEGTGHSAPELLALLERGETLPRFDLALRLRATIRADVTQLVSENVIGILPASRRGNAREQVVLSAHLDHLGIASEGEGDRIHNGAMDNASGIAVLMNIARGLQQSKASRKRSIVFAAVTAEESGLLGSRAMVSRASGQRASIVANLNTDMFLPLYPLKKLTVFGLDESDLGNDVRAVGKELDVAIQPDPQPLRNRFVRSDQYSFVRAGIPALALKSGFDAGSAEAEIERKWFADRYHAPSDDLAQPVDFEAMGKYADLLQSLALRVANRRSNPRWYTTSAFAASGEQRD
jgi:hypothetical protein